MRLVTLLCKNSHCIHSSPRRSDFDPRILCERNGAVLGRDQREDGYNRTGYLTVPETPGNDEERAG
jgi:hypothetical protein